MRAFRISGGSVLSHRESTTEMRPFVTNDLSEKLLPGCSVHDTPSALTPHSLASKPALSISNADVHAGLGDSGKLGAASPSAASGRSSQYKAPQFIPMPASDDTMDDDGDVVSMVGVPV